MKFTIRLKGGAGSGHHGHKGILGHQGGSLPKGDLSSADVVDYSDVPVITKLSQLSKSRGGSKGYWIMQDGTMIDGRLGKDGWHEDSMIDLSKKNPQYSPSSDRINYSTHAVDNMGAIRVQVTPREVVIETKDVNESTLKRLQNLVDEGKISSKKTISWGGTVKLSPVLAESYNSESTSYTVSVEPEEFMVATNMGWVKGYGGWAFQLKEFRLKGGPGSGHYGHKGRKGQEGGSLPRGESQSSASNSYHDLGQVPSVGDVVLIKFYDGETTGKVVSITEIDKGRSTPTVHTDNGYKAQLDSVYPVSGVSTFVGIDKSILESRVYNLTTKYRDLSSDKLNNKVLSELSKYYKDDNNVARKWNKFEKDQIIEWLTSHRRFL
jgi:hypothetical protein